VTKDDYLRIAREIWPFNLGMSDGYGETISYIKDYASVDLTDHMYAFASAIAALEREECAKVCDEVNDRRRRNGITNGYNAIMDCKEAIRNKEGK
jgi:hypothetical protein